MEIDIIREHIKDMLEVRGDDVSYIEEHGDAVEKNRYFNEIITLHTDNTTIFFALNKDLLKEWKNEESSADEMIETYGTKMFIVIITDQPSSTLMNQLNERDKQLQNLGGILQIFYTKELLYNPLKHTLVPKHEKMSQPEGKAIMEQYKIKNKTQMPGILKTDIIAKWLGLKHNDIVKITRYNETSGTYYYYRSCI